MLKSMAEGEIKEACIPCNNVTHSINKLEDTINDAFDSLLMEINLRDQSSNGLEETTKEALDSLLIEINDVLGDMAGTCAAESCSDILRNDPDASSGYYSVRNATGHPHRVYCDMTKSCGGITGSWMKVAYLDMTNTSHQCPSGLRHFDHYGLNTLLPTVTMQHAPLFCIHHMESTTTRSVEKF